MNTTKKIILRTLDEAAQTPTLKIENGEIVCMDGSKPDFSDLEGMEINIIQNEGFRKLVTEASMCILA